MQVTLSDAAALAALKHALKYRSQVCVGILLGLRANNEDYQITQVVPVAHHELIGSAAATTLAMIAQYLRRRAREDSNDALQMLGVYFYDIEDVVSRSNKDKVENCTIRALLQPIQNDLGASILLKGGFEKRVPVFHSCKLEKNQYDVQKWTEVATSDAFRRSASDAEILRCCASINDMELFLVEPSLNVLSK